jgi:hypothetical protein
MPSLPTDQVRGFWAGWAGPFGRVRTLVLTILYDSVFTFLALTSVACLIGLALLPPGEETRGKELPT